MGRYSFFKRRVRSRYAKFVDNVEATTSVETQHFGEVGVVFRVDFVDD